MNASNEITFELTKSNGDELQMLNHNIGYATKYPTKVQDTVDSVATLNRYTAGVNRSFANRDARELLQPDLTEEQKAAGRMYSLLFSYSNVQEVADTMAAWYVLKQSKPMYQSHKTDHLVLAAALKMINNQEEVSH